MALPWPRFLKQSMLALSGVLLSLYLTFSILWDCISLSDNGGSADKEQVYQCRRCKGSVLGLGRSPGKGSSNQLQCSCLGNSMDRGDWQATVPGVTKSQTQLSVHAHTHTHTHPDHEGSFVFRTLHKNLGSNFSHFSWPSLVLGKTKQKTKKREDREDNIGLYKWLWVSETHGPLQWRGKEDLHE